MRRLAAALAACLLLVAPGALGQAERPGRRLALVVAAPADPATAAVARQSTELVAQGLRKAGFDVLAPEPTRAGLLGGLAAFRQAAAGADLALAYFVGTTIAVGQETFLLPAGVSLSDPADLVFGAVELDWLAAALQDASGRPAALLLDPLAPATPGALPEALGTDVRAGLALPATPAPGLLLLSSLAPGAAAAAPRGTGPAPLAEVFAREAAKPDLTLRQLATAVARALPNGGTQVQDGLRADASLWRPPVGGPPIEVVAEPAELEAGPKGAVIRRLPARDADALQRLREGAPVSQLGRVKGMPGWVAVKLGDKVGYAFASALRQPLPPPPPPPLLEPGPYLTKAPGHLFEQPLVGAKSLRDVPAGERVQLLESKPDGRMGHVELADGLRGYMRLGNLVPAGTEGPPPPPPQPPLIPPPSCPGPEDVEGVPEPAFKAACRAQEVAALAADKASEAARAASAAEQAQARARQSAGQARARAADLGVTIRYANGQTYAGDTKGQVREGFGVWLFESRGRHEGEWAANLKVGHGVMTLDNGDGYEGAFAGDRRQGHGIMTFSGGGTFLGAFDADQIGRLGEFRFPDQSVYRGEFKDGVPHGLGERTYPDGSVYVGQFSGGLAEGPGWLRFRSGSRHLGDFRRGEQGGPGISYSPSGQRRFGTWAGPQLLAGQQAQN